MKTNRDLFLAVARTVDGERSACIVTTLRQSEYADIFAVKISEEEFAARLQEAEREPTVAFRRLYEPIQERTKSWSAGRN
jgi:hypothetical protein